jgi:actin-related protein
MKEKLCYVSMDLEADKAKAAESTELTKNYELPDGQVVSVNTPRFMAPEALFDPGLIKEGDEALGIHEMSFASIQDCDVDIRMDLYGNIILSGGTTLYAGLPDRLEQEVDKMCHKMCPEQVSAKIIASQDRYYSVWTGGSILSNL